MLWLGYGYGLSLVHFRSVGKEVREKAVWDISRQVAVALLKIFSDLFLRRFAPKPHVQRLLQ